MSDFYGGWRPYVPVGQRRAQALVQMERLRKDGVDIQPVEITGRTIARSFWGKGWCTHLESFGDYSNRLPRGRTYVRNGSVCHLDIREGRVEAMVSGSDLYHVTVEIAPLKKTKWNVLKRRCTGKIASLIELLQGRLSEELMGVVADRNDGLFPLPGEITFECDCPDWADMCKHISAVMYGIGARLDSRPELLFTLRGADHGELISEETSAAAIAGSGSQRARRRALAGQDLENVFGVELEDAPDAQTAPKPAKRRKAREKTAPKKTSKGKVKSAPKRKNARPKSRSRATRSPAPFKPSARSIAALRRRLGMSKSEFARAVGVSLTTVTNWESALGVLTLHQRNVAGLTRLHGSKG